MALASNTKDQLAKRLQRDIQLMDGALTVTLTASSDGYPMVKVARADASILALAAVKTKHYDGFNIVAEISSSAGEGMPEHDLWVVLDSAAAFADNAKMIKACSKMGTASMKLIQNAAPADSQMVDANVAIDLPNSAALGAVGQ